MYFFIFYEFFSCMPEIDESDQENFFLLKYLLQDKNQNNTSDKSEINRFDNNLENFHSNQNSADGTVRKKIS